MKINVRVTGFMHETICAGILLETGIVDMLIYMSPVQKQVYGVMVPLSITRSILSSILFIVQVLSLYYGFSRAPAEYSCNEGYDRNGHIKFLLG